MSEDGRPSGADAVTAALEEAGVEVVFGMPGTRNLALFESLRRSRLRTVVPTHELAAAFMANGYHRASGRLAALATIGGPGLTYALGGLAEASLDSAALVYIVERRVVGDGPRFGLQSIDQAALARPVSKAVIEVHCASELRAAVARACRLALEGEPGPVVVQVSAEVLEGPEEEAPPRALADGRGDGTPSARASGRGESPPPASTAGRGESPPGAAVVPEEVARLVALSRRPLFFVGQGVLAAAPALLSLAERLGAPVATTSSARGAMPEDHELVLLWDSADAVEALNELVAESDLVLALACKLSHNGTAAYRLKLPPEKLVHVDASADVLGANYPARHLVRMDAGAFIEATAAAAGARAGAGGWDPTRIAALRARAAERHGPGPLEPPFTDLAPPDSRGFFAALRRVLPAAGILVTDSGLHQILARRHFRVASPRGLIAPSDFQSMGFGLPAAIGAKLAEPHRPVVALIGDGGVAMSGLELLTAVREKVSLPVVVFNDGALGVIKVEQITTYGRPHATDLVNPDFALLAQSCGAKYELVQGDPEPALRRALASGGATVLEVRLGEARPLRRMQTRATAREGIQRLLGSRVTGWLLRLLGR